MKTATATPVLPSLNTTAHQLLPDNTRNWVDNVCAKISIISSILRMTVTAMSQLFPRVNTDLTGHGSAQQLRPISYHVFFCLTVKWQLPCLCLFLLSCLFGA
uniref:Uncharacterized protein n=1 Tax=Neolamprologus brichardi TaxID=32507 RepID=A0A3Q4HET8_NEOBR